MRKPVIALCLAAISFIYAGGSANAADLSIKHHQPQLLSLLHRGRRVITAIMGCFTVDGFTARRVGMALSLIAMAVAAT